MASEINTVGGRAGNGRYTEVKTKALGRQLMVEFYSCNPDILNDVDGIAHVMEDAALISGATVVEKVFHHFSPHGVSGVVVISESHLAIHTWPEYGYAAVDLFTCGEEVDPYKGFEYLKTVLGAGNVSISEMKRGLLADPSGRALHKPAPEQMVNGVHAA